MSNLTRRDFLKTGAYLGLGGLVYGCAGSMQLIEPDKSLEKRTALTCVLSLPFDEAKRELEENGYRVISLEENIFLRMQSGKDASLMCGNWTREGFVFVPKEGVYLVRHSPVLDNPEKATKAHYDGKEFYPTKKQVEKALEDSVLIRFESPIRIPTNRLGDDDITSFAFGEQAKAYGEFLKEVGIEQMPIWFVDKNRVDVEKKPFARQVRFGRLNPWPFISCGMALDLCLTVRGVKGY